MDNKNIKYKEKEKLKFKTKDEASLGSEVAGSLCPSCTHINDDAALFCEECGTSLKQTNHCPNCNAVARPHADICESCGTWLLKGQCMFCYAPVEEEQKFCGECGSSASGIECPQCKEVSIFDFCKTCHIPLSNQAQEMMQEAKSDEAFQELNVLIEEISSMPELVDEKESTKDKQPVDNKEYEAYLKLKTYRDSLDKPTKQSNEREKAKPLFSQKHKEQINQLNVEVQQEEERKEQIRIEEERKKIEAEKKRRLLHEKFQAALKQMETKKFSSNQEARRFYMSVLAQFPQEFMANSAISIGWRCNAYGSFHSDGPSGCAAPEQGGAWIVG